jgi:hypothetical protein
MTQSPGPTMATTLTRQVRTGWYHDAAGGWAYEGVDDHLWEVFCQQCGDTDGPRRIRNQRFASFAAPTATSTAEHAANKHFKAFRGA